MNFLLWISQHWFVADKGHPPYNMKSSLFDLAGCRLFECCCFEQATVLTRTICRPYVWWLSLIAFSSSTLVGRTITVQPTSPRTSPSSRRLFSWRPRKSSLRLLLQPFPQRTLSARRWPHRWRRQWRRASSTSRQALSTTQQHCRVSQLPQVSHVLVLSLTATPQQWLLWTQPGRLPLPPRQLLSCLYLLPPLAVAMHSPQRNGSKVTSHTHYLTELTSRL